MANVNNLKYIEEHEQALLFAARNQYNSVVTSILTSQYGKHININVMGKKCMTPLKLAIQQNNEPNIEKYITHKGIDINDSRGGQRPIELAIKVSTDNVIDMLLRHPDIDIKFTNKDGDNLLMLAKKYNRTKCFMKLVTLGLESSD